MRNEQPSTKEIVSVAEMARMIGLSRTRFYGLLADGVLPAPSRHPNTARPFFTRQQQEQCLLVRRTNCGVNGKPILFYSVAPRPSQAKPKAQSRKAGSSSQTGSDPLIEDLKHGLSQLGLVDVADSKLRAALAESHPEGYQSVDPATLLMSVFRHLRCQNPNDNVT